MPVVGSGQIDLNQIHVEAGGSSATQCTMNESDIRGLIDKAATTQMALSEWYGASASWETVITCGNPGGGSPGVYTGYAATGALSNPSGGGTSNPLGTATVVLDPIPPSDGVASWTLNLFGRGQGYGAQTFYFGLRDSANPAQADNQPNIVMAGGVPFSKITMSHSSNYTGTVCEMAGSLFTQGTTYQSNSGCQVLWSFSTDLEDTNPSYHDITDVLFTTGNVYIKIE